MTNRHKHENVFALQGFDRVQIDVTILKPSSNYYSDFIIFSSINYCLKWPIFGSATVYYKTKANYWSQRAKKVIEGSFWALILTSIKS